MEADSPHYDNFGFFSVNYKPKLQLKDEMKVRPFISGIDANTLPNGALKLVYERYDFLSNDGSINFIFSSNGCLINSPLMNVIIFDPTTPGVLYLDGLLEQNSLQSVTEISIAKNGMEELRIYFMGLTEFSIRRSSQI